MPRTAAGPRTVAGARGVAPRRLLVRDFGTCLQFDGSQNYLSIAGTGSDPNFQFNLGDSISFAAWVYVTSFASSPFVFTKDIGDGSTGDPIIYFAGQTPRLGFVSTVPNTQQFGGGIVQPNVWTHVVWQYTFGTPASAAIWINGVSQSISWLNTGNGTPTTNSSAAQLARKGNSSEYLPGQLDEVYLYRRLLTATEIQNLYFSGIDPAATSLVAHWKFDAGSGTTAADSSGNGYTGTLAGSPTPKWSTNVVMKPRGVAS